MIEHLLLGLAIGIGFYLARPIAGLLLLVGTTMAAVVIVGAIVTWNAIVFCMKTVIDWFVES